LGQLADGLGWVTQNGPMDNSDKPQSGVVLQISQIRLDKKTRLCTYIYYNSH